MLTNAESHVHSDNKIELIEKTRAQKKIVIELTAPKIDTKSNTSSS